MKGLRGCTPGGTHLWGAGGAFLTRSFFCVKESRELSDMRGLGEIKVIHGRAREYMAGEGGVRREGRPMGGTWRPRSWVLRYIGVIRS